MVPVPTVVETFDDDELLLLASKLRNSIEIRNRTYHLKTYPNCFLGTDAVKLLMKLVPESDIETCEKIGQEMIDKQIIYHVAKEQPFKNMKFFYRFSSSSSSQVEKNASFSLCDSDRNLAFSFDDPDDNDFIFLAMLLHDSLEIRDRTYHLKNYHDCFLGTDAVKQLVGLIPGAGVEKAITIGQEMIEKGIIYHVVKKQPFQNKQYFYRFAVYDDGNPDSLTTAFDEKVRRSAIKKQQTSNSNTRTTDAPATKRRFSDSLGDIQLEYATLDDLKQRDATSKEPLRILITTHSLNVVQSNTIKRGLGLWVFYILRDYLIMRNVPHVLFLKSVVVEKHAKRVVDPFKATTVENMGNFIKRNNIDILIPSDVTDTQFVARNYDFFSSIVKLAVTPDLGVYQKLEDKWETYCLMTQIGVPTPQTKKIDLNDPIPQSYPFFLKIASGTNSGRGVWFIQNDEQLVETLASKSVKNKDVTLLAQQPTLGRVICSEIVYDHGRVLGFFFAQSVQADDLAGVGNKYIWGGDDPEDYSHEKVELETEQWEAITRIFKKVGKATGYHGMIDIEFIIANGDNEGVEEGSVWLLECNPRFSGDIHTTLSNPGFLDTYFDVIMEDVDYDETPIKNFSAAVELRTKFALFKPLPFYTRHPGMILNLRNWNNDANVRFEAVGEAKRLEDVKE